MNDSQSLNWDIVAKTTSRSTQTSYIKSPHLTAVIEDAGITCEQKLERIKALIDGKKLSLLKSGEAIKSKLDNNESSSNAVAPNNEYDMILNDLNGAKERELGETILQSINQSDYMSYDRNSLEIIIASETIRFTNIKSLIQFCVKNDAAVLPIGLTLFLEGLLHIKTAVHAIRSGDSVAIKDDLLKIGAIREKDRAVLNRTPVNNDDARVVVNEGGDAAAVNSATDAAAVVDKSQEGRKRRRGVDEEEEEDLAPASKKFGLDDKSLNNLRRSPRLTQKLDEAWKSALVAPSTGKKKRVRK